MVVGYTTGVYDLFHIGHLNLLKNARGLCDKLIVGVTIDALVEYKNKRAVIPFEERIEIVRNIKCVDAAIPQETLDKFKAWEKLHFDRHSVCRRRLVQIRFVARNGREIQAGRSARRLLPLHQGHQFYVD